MWIVWGIVSALGTSVRSIISKHTLESLSEFMVLWVMFLTASFISFLLLIVSGINIADSQFWLLLVIKTVLDTIAFILFLRALKLSSVSVVIPLLSFMPILSSISAVFLNGELINIVGVFGIVVISLANLGLYLSQRGNQKEISDLNKAIILILVVMLCWSFLDPIHKLGIESSNSITYFSLGNIAVLISLTVIGIFSKKIELGALKAKKVTIFSSLIGVIFVIEFMSQLAAFAQTYVGYVSALKSTYIIMAPLLGTVFLKEKINLAHVAAITMSLIGIMLMIFSSEILDWLLTLIGNF